MWRQVYPASVQHERGVLFQEKNRFDTVTLNDNIESSDTYTFVLLYVFFCRPSSKLCLYYCNKG